VQVQALAVNLRLRGMHDAADLGLRLAQVHARQAWGLFLPLWGLLSLAALSYPGGQDWLPLLLLFCAKPWVDRVLLFVYARAVFGERSGWAELWAARRQVLFGQWFSTWTLRRLSPWRSFTQPIRQLEGQRGKALRERRALLLNGRRGAAAMMQFAFAQAELMLSLLVPALLTWAQLPGADGADLLDWLFDETGTSWVATLSYAVAVALLEPFYVASGFAMYLNRRAELEAWDVEQALRHAFAR
jgi:hypothetical protein